MIRKTNNKSLNIWLEEIWEEIQIQFYGITIAIIFFLLLYLVFNPPWMKTFRDLLYKIKLIFWN